MRQLIMKKKNIKKGSNNLSIMNSNSSNGKANVSNMSSILISSNNINNINTST